MTAVNKQDSNTTELRFAVEDTPGHVPSNAVWYPLEPNSYKNFGGDVKLKARMPINASRQMKKGVVVDLDAQGGWQQDLTQTNFQALSEYFLFAALRKKSELSVAVVDGTANAYQPTSGGTAYYAGDLLFAKAFTQAANNGLKKATGVPAAANIPVTDTGLLTETGATGVISRVGFEFGAGQLQVDVSDSLPKIKVASVAASGTLTTTGTLDDTETVTIGGVVYTVQLTLTAGAGHVHRGANVAATLVNLKNAINQGGAGAPGVDYDAATTPANPYVTATSDATHLVVTAKVGGAVGNVVTTTETFANASWGAVTLTGGSGGRSLDSFGLIPGEPLFLGDDAAATHFFHSVCNGFCRIRSISANEIHFDKTQSIMVADDGTDTGAGGTGQTIRILFSRVVKNEADPTLILKRSIQLERALGQPDDASTATQGEYLTRGIADQLKLDCKHADIVRMEMDFICNTNELRPASDGLKPGTRPTLADSDAFNTTSDIAFTKLAIVTAGNPCPTPLFSFFTDLVLDLKNNVKQNKAVSVLGAFDSTAGFFQVSANLTGYFTDVSEMQAVKDNKSVTLETHFVKFNQGITIDVPLVTMSKALADVKLNEAIMIPLASDAATAKIIDPSLDYTLLIGFWDYLPTLAG